MKLKIIPALSGFFACFIIFSSFAIQYPCPPSLDPINPRFAGPLELSSLYGNDPQDEAWILRQSVYMPNNESEGSLICVYAKKNVAPKSWTAVCAEPQYHCLGNNYSSERIPDKGGKNCSFNPDIPGPIGSKICNGAACVLTCHD